PEPQEAPIAAETASSSGGKMSQDDIEKMIAAAATAEATPEPQEAPIATETASSSGGQMSQAEIEALLNGMAVDAKK
ncbi:MAG: hypothetical protein J1F03_08900, partial [Oscillospiraceae bacterium]|nr:hypothetical protein [Oscillospiraceae bacterium]